MTSGPRAWAGRAVVGLVAAMATLGGPVAGAAPAADPAFASQWNLQIIGIEQAWEANRGAGVTVAVIDSGAVLAHEDLQGAIVGHVNCIDAFASGGACEGSADDDDGHGTHVAGIVGARADNGVGLAGVAPEADLLIVRALRHTCRERAVGPDCIAEGAAVDTAAAVDWSVANGADIINLSLADPASLGTTSPLARAILRAWNAGVIVVAASGNQGDIESTGVWGNVPIVVVTATTPNDVRASYANGVGGARWGLAAPGGSGDSVCPANEVLSAYTAPAGATDAYACLSGTSMAAPHVSGVLAILLAAGSSPEQAIAQVLASADDLGDPGPDPIYGRGRLNAARAIETQADTSAVLGDGDFDIIEENPSTRGSNVLFTIAAAMLIVNAVVISLWASRWGARRRGRMPG